MIIDDHQQEHTNSLIGNPDDEYDFHHHVQYDENVIDEDENDGGRIPSLSSSFKDDNSLFSENDREHYRVLRESLNSINVTVDTDTTTSNSDVHHHQHHHQRCHRHQRSFSSNVSDPNVLKKSNNVNNNNGTPSKLLMNTSTFTATPNSSCSMSTGLVSIINNDDDVDRSEQPKDDFSTKHALKSFSTKNNNTVKFIDSPQRRLPHQQHQAIITESLPSTTTARRTPSSFPTEVRNRDDDEENKDKKESNRVVGSGGFRLWVGVNDCYQSSNYQQQHHHSSADDTSSPGDAVVVSSNCSPVFQREDIVIS